MRRRDFITLLGSTVAALPLAARAQQPRMPVIGVLYGVTVPEGITAYWQGLRETGFVEGHNVIVESRSADGKYDRLPALAADLVRRKVDVIFATGPTPSAQAAKAATSAIPIVFTTGTDPVASGLVSNLRRPEANLTGVTQNITALTPKRLEIARELLPAGALIGYLRNPANPFDTDEAELRAAAETLRLKVSEFSATTDRELLTSFDSMAQQKIAALIVSTDASFGARRNQIVALAAHHAIPTIYAGRRYVVAGGLISYGVEFPPLTRLAGIYTGRILKGDKPSDLPVILPTKFELVLNLKTAKELGIEVPLPLLIRIDETIE
jgi:putative tryptophan/tyrosine transport system substrate-binding protein